MADGARSAGCPAPESAQDTQPGGPAAPPEPQGPAEGNAAETEGPRPLGVGLVPTGHPPLDARLRRLEDADRLAVSGHLDVYEDVHRGLRETLADLDRHEQ